MAYKFVDIVTVLHLVQTPGYKEKLHIRTAPSGSGLELNDKVMFQLDDPNYEVIGVVRDIASFWVEGPEYHYLRRMVGKDMEYRITKKLLPMELWQSEDDAEEAEESQEGEGNG